MVFTTGVIFRLDEPGLLSLAFFVPPFALEDFLFATLSVPRRTAVPHTWPIEAATSTVVHRAAGGARGA